MTFHLSKVSFKFLVFLLFRCSELPEVNQIEMHPYLFDECNVKANKELGILVQAYSPMGSGSLDERPELAEKKFREFMACVLLDYSY